MEGARGPCSLMRSNTQEDVNNITGAKVIHVMFVIGNWDQIL